MRGHIYIILVSYTGTPLRYVWNVAREE